MLRRVLQLASCAILAGLSLLYPLLESLDDLDSPIPASDLEIEAIVLFTFVGFLFVLAHLLASVAILVVMGAFRYLIKRVSIAIQLHDLVVHSFQSPSPPLPLRI